MRMLFPTRDDHEITNDPWEFGAENHDASEGKWSARKRDSVRAFHEWMPIRSNDMQFPGNFKENLKIYRYASNEFLIVKYVCKMSFYLYNL